MTRRTCVVSNFLIGRRCVGGVANFPANICRPRAGGDQFWMRVRPDVTTNADPKHLYDKLLVVIDAEQHLNNGHSACQLFYKPIET